VVERQQERERSEYDELKNHYECIEKVLNEENLNLKMQAKYLASEMRKSLKREKLQKEELKNINELYEKTNNRLTLIMQ
jgi:tRNA C32,U32 (ribose-2'-O)-methylase TrmJ